MALPEPWLRGPIPGVDPLVANLFYTFTQTREELDAIAGASNVPDAIAALRRKGLEIPSCREPVTDRDAEIVYRGRYRFSENDLNRTRSIWEGGDDGR